MERLDQYRRRRRFPKNQRFPGRFLPHFIDEEGTRCALGHLIELSGERDLVQRIARERNYARVRELRVIPELVRWLEANGLTVAEAARIQPEYCGPPAQNCFCGTAFGGGVVKGSLGDAGATLTVTAIYGPVAGVAVGDVLVLYESSSVSTATEVFARPNGAGMPAEFAFAVENGEVTIPTSECWSPGVASIPGPLPLATVEEALSSTNQAACVSVLTAYDSEWGVNQGDCSGLEADTDDGGCSVAGHPSGSSGVAMALCAACLVRHVRRLRAKAL